MTTDETVIVTEDTHAGTPLTAAAQDAHARIRDVAIEQFGRHGFDAGLQAIADAADVSQVLILHHFGSKEGLRKACDDYILESIRTSKSEVLQSASPTAWFSQLAQIESFAPMMAYLAQSMQSSGDLGRTLTRRLIANAEQYLEDGVQAGTIKPSRDPKARAKFLAMAGGGGFLLYLHMHDNPNDMASVLRDYGQEMILPALEIYTDGLMTDATMYDAFVTMQEAGENGAPTDSAVSA